MNKFKSIAKLIAAFGAVLGVNAVLPEPYGVIAGAIVAAATYIAKSPFAAE
jgi:hypothetical protein